jgi:hypothetical protein
MTMGWSLKGTYFENCNCDVLCPCGASSLVLPADNERCVVAFAFHVDSGAIDGIDVSGLSLVIVADAPGQMIKGGWRVGVILDAAATPQQAGLLGAVFGGQRGGPMGMLAPLIGEQLGVKTAPIEYSNGGTSHRVKAGDLVEMVVEDFVPQGMSEPTKLVGVGHPVNTTLTVAQAKISRVKCFGLDLSNAGKNGHAAPFSWSGT